MAKLAKIECEKKKLKTFQKYRDTRLNLKEKLRQLQKDFEANFEKIARATEELQKLPKNASPVRLRNRCKITGRSRGTYRRFDLSRSELRKLVLQGLVPGMRKASW